MCSSFYGHLMPIEAAIMISDEESRRVHGDLADLVRSVCGATASHPLSSGNNHISRHNSENFISNPHHQYHHLQVSSTQQQEDKDHDYSSALTIIYDDQQQQQQRLSYVVDRSDHHLMNISVDHFLGGDPFSSFNMMMADPPHRHSEGAHGDDHLTSPSSYDDLILCSSSPQAAGDHSSSILFVDHHHHERQQLAAAASSNRLDHHHNNCNVFSTNLLVPPPAYSPSINDKLHPISLASDDSFTAVGDGIGSDLHPLENLSSPAAAFKRRNKSVTKKVVCVPAPAPAPANYSRPSGEVVPSDLWAWRKYGQKPIKGSPYPRGYYRCSSSKGCSARKQVERSRTDPKMLVITYTSEHNHPWPTQRNALAGSTRPSHSHQSTRSNNHNLTSVYHHDQTS